MLNTQSTTKIAGPRRDLTSNEISRAILAHVRRLMKMQRKEWNSRRQISISTLLTVNRMIVLADTKTLRSLLDEIDVSI